MNDIWRAQNDKGFHVHTIKNSAVKRKTNRHWQLFWPILSWWILKPINLGGLCFLIFTIQSFRIFHVAGSHFGSWKQGRHVEAFTLRASGTGRGRSSSGWWFRNLARTPTCDGHKSLFFSGKNLTISTGERRSSVNHQFNRQYFFPISWNENISRLVHTLNPQHFRW